MSRRVTDAPGYVKNSILLDLLKSQEGFTNNEVKAYISVVFGKDSPVTVADDAQIPKSKVYSTLEELVNSGYINISENNRYYARPNRIINIIETGKKLTEDYVDFLDFINSFATGDNRITTTISDSVFNAFKNNNYRVDNIKEVYSGESFESIIQNIRSYTREYSLLRRKRITGRDIRKIDAEDVFDFINIISESNTTGIRIGTAIMTEVKKNSKESIELYSEILLKTLNLQKIILIFSPLISIEIKNQLINEIKDSKLLISNTLIIMAEIDKINEQIDLLVDNLVTQYRITKDNLGNYENIKDNMRKDVREITLQLEVLMSEVSIYPDQYEEVYSDLYRRAKRDLQTCDKLIFDIEDYIRRSYEVLYRNKIISHKNIRSLEERINSTQKMINDKKEEIQNFMSDQLTYNFQRNPYSKYGYLVNPFSLRVPLSNPSKIIDQQENKEKMELFLNSFQEGTDNNLFFIVGDEGGGKSHFLNYYQSQINSNKGLAIKIECMPNRDLVDIYPQIRTQITKHIDATASSLLNVELSILFDESGSPRTISDLIDIIRKITQILQKYEITSFFIFIDEFENTLPSDRIMKRWTDYSSFEFTSPESIMQLDSLTQLGYVGFIVTMRYVGWERWNGIMNDRIHKIDNNNCIRIRPLSLEHTVDLINYRLYDEPFRTSIGENDPPSFSDESVVNIHTESSGNPRKILLHAERTFRKAIEEAQRTIQP